MRDSDRAIPRGGAVKWERIKQERVMGSSAGERILADSWKGGRAWTPSQSGDRTRGGRRAPPRTRRGGEGDKYKNGIMISRMEEVPWDGC